MQRAMDRIEKLDEQNKSNAKKDEKSEDDIFCEFVNKMLREIPNSNEKDLLKLEFQSKIISLRHKKAQESTVFRQPIFASPSINSRFSTPLRINSNDQSYFYQNSKYGSSSSSATSPFTEKDM